MKFSEQVKALVRERTNMLCDRCGLRVHNPQYHHRKPRRMGGSKDTAIGQASNALLLHPNCHEWIERHRTISYEQGWLVASYQEPSEIPVVRAGDLVLLGDDGTATVIDARLTGVLSEDEVAYVNSATTSSPL